MIKDLEVKQGNVELIAEVVEIGEVREFSKFGKAGRVATAIIKDDSGQVKLSLWNEQIDKIHAGDKVHIKNGYVSEWQGEKQITTGRLGTIDIIEKGREKTQEEAKEEITEDVPETTEEEIQ